MRWHNNCTKLVLIVLIALDFKTILLIAEATEVVGVDFNW
jgi:hypothetical protein